MPQETSDRLEQRAETDKMIGAATALIMIQRLAVASALEATPEQVASWEEALADTAN